jgi:Integrase core domain
MSRAGDRRCRTGHHEAREHSHAGKLLTPATQTPRRRSAAAAFRAFPAPCVVCRRPAPLHAAQAPHVSGVRRMSGSPGGCERSLASIHGPDGRPPMRSSMSTPARRSRSASGDCTARDVVEVIAGRMTLMATSYIEPGSPWENPFVESFNGRPRDELPDSPPEPRQRVAHRGFVRETPAA